MRVTDMRQAPVGTSSRAIVIDKTALNILNISRCEYIL